MRIKMDTTAISWIISCSIIAIAASCLIYYLFLSTNKNKEYTPDLNITEKYPSLKNRETFIDKKELSSSTTIKKDDFNEASFFIPWDYNHQDSWDSLDPSFNLCSQGIQQSPLDINDINTIKSSLDIKINYTPEDVYLSSNNKEFKIRTSKKSYLTLKGKKFILEKVNVHTPSEHHINDLRYDMEWELFHRADDKEILILSILFERANKNESVSSIIENIPEKFDFEKKVANFNFKSLVPKQSFYYYAGSLSYPPCTEGVKRLVLKSIVNISEKQLDEFNRKFNYGNVRKIQSKNTREVLNIN